MAQVSPSSPQIGWKFWLLTLLAAILLLVANSALWVNRTVFSTANFTQLASTALAQESSRVAMATEVTDQLLSKRPVLQRVIDEPMIKVIAGLLGSDRASNAIDKVISRLHVGLTSANPQSVAFDLTRLKSILQRAIDLADVPETKFDPNDIPDQIVLIDANKIPHFYQYGVVFLWLAPLAAIAGIGLLAWPYLRRPIDAWKLPLIQGLVIGAVGLVGLMMGPMFKPPVLANVASPNIRVVVENVYDAFMQTFERQTQWLLWLALAFLVAGAIWWLSQHREIFNYFKGKGEQKSAA